jgi:hypothetical protein
MVMEVLGRLMQARFVEIHKVFAKKRSDTFLSFYLTASKA